MKMIRRDCGACNACCTLLMVPDIGKPAKMTCWWTTVHGGCSRQAEKETDPQLQACAQFACLWLESQVLAEEAMVMSRNMRPDMSHVLMFRDNNDPKLLWAQVDPRFPNAWQEEPVAGYLNGFLSRGGRLEVVIDERHVKLPAE